MAGYVGNIPVPQATQTRQSFTATASQTSFPTIGYTEGFFDCHLNGVKLLAGVDFNVGGGNGSDVILATGAALNDILEVTIFDTFTTSSASFANATLTSSTLKSNVTLKNDSEEDSDGGRASKIIYQGEQSGGEISTLAEIQASHDLAADDQKGDLIFRTNDGSDGTSPTEAMRIDSAQNVGIGTVSPASLLHVDSDNNFGNILLSRDGGAGGRRPFGIGITGAADNDLTISASADTDQAGAFEGDRKEIVRFLAGGGMTFNGDTAAANALDDYEEGSWTPSFSFSSGSVGYSYQSGQYTKIGRKVFLTANLIVNSVSSPSGACTVVTLPFNSGTDSNATTNEGYVAGVTVSIVRSLGSSLTLRAYVPANSNYITLTKNVTNQGHVSFNASDLTASSLIYLSATYNAAS